MHARHPIPHQLPSHGLLLMLRTLLKHGALPAIALLVFALPAEAQNRLYFGSPGTNEIISTDLNGTGEQTIVDEIDAGRGVALGNSYLYFTNAGGANSFPDDAIGRRLDDGSGPIEVLLQNVNLPGVPNLNLYDIDLDVDSQDRVFFVDGATGNIYRADVLEVGSCSYPGAPQNTRPAPCLDNVEVLVATGAIGDIYATVYDGTNDLLYYGISSPSADPGVYRVAASAAAPATPTLVSNDPDAANVVWLALEIDGFGNTLNDIYVTTENNQVAVVDPTGPPATNAVLLPGTGAATGGSTYRGIAFDPNQRRVFFATSTGIWEQEVDSPTTDADFLFNPDETYDIDLLVEGCDIADEPIYHGVVNGESIDGAYAGQFFLHFTGDDDPAIGISLVQIYNSENLNVTGVVLDGAGVDISAQYEKQYLNTDTAKPSGEAGNAEVDLIAGTAPTEIYVEIEAVGGDPRVEFFGIGQDVCLRTVDVDPVVELNEQLGLEAELPTEPALEGNYPNPFNPQTTIRFTLPEAMPITLTVYDVMGRQIRTLVQGTVEAGQHEVMWDGRSATGQAVPSGTYFYRVDAGGFSQTMQMTLLK